MTGGKSHKTRFHDEKGNRLDWKGFIYLPHCLLTTILRLTIGYRPILPWISYRAIKVLDELIQSDWKMLEWGSGMSTLWFAERVGHLTTIEDNNFWYDKVISTLKKVSNVDYRFLTGNSYFNLEQFAEHEFDFILIDGSQRGNCAKHAVRKIKPGGYIYLDNSDKHSTEEGGDIRVAEEILLQAVNERGGEVKYFVDLVPTYLAVNQGMLIKLL